MRASLLDLFLSVTTGQYSHPHRSQIWGIHKDSDKSKAWITDTRDFSSISLLCQPLHSRPTQWEGLIQTLGWTQKVQGNYGDSTVPASEWLLNLDLSQPINRILLKPWLRYRNEMALMWTKEMCDICYDQDLGCGCSVTSHVTLQLSQLDLFLLEPFLPWWVVVSNHEPK